MGVAVYAMNEPEKTLIQRADDALFLAKENGRDQIMTQDDL